MTPGKTRVHVKTPAHTQHCKNSDKGHLGSRGHPQLLKTYDSNNRRFMTSLLIHGTIIGSEAMWIAIAYMVKLYLHTQTMSYHMLSQIVTKYVVLLSSIL